MTTRTIVVTVPSQLAEIVTDRMWQWGVQAVSETVLDTDRVEVATSVGNKSIAVERAMATLDPSWPTEIRDVDDSIAQVAPEYLSPTWYLDGMVSVPASLLPFEPDDRHALVTVIDPGSAFGLGDHPTTRTAMALLAGLLRGDRAVPCTSLLDVGCGTGALALDDLVERYPAIACADGNLALLGNGFDGSDKYPAVGVFCVIPEAVNTITKTRATGAAGAYG